MADPLKVIIKFFAEPGDPFGFGSPSITKSYDITAAVKNIDIDPTCFIDEDTLLVSERKCSLTLINRYNIYKGIKQYLTDVAEDIIISPTDVSGSTVLDNQIVNPDSDRVVNFIYPHIYCKHNSYADSDLGSSYLAYPVIYHPPTEESGYYHSFIPILEHDEDRYNDYDNAYRKERPKYHNLLIEVYFYDSLQYVGIALINTLKFNIKSNEISIEFTDPIGVMIDCLNKMNSFPNFYQGVNRTGLLMSFLDDLPRRTIEMFYHRLRNLFNFKKFLNRPDNSWHIQAVCSYGSNYDKTYYDFKIFTSGEWEYNTNYWSGTSYEHGVKSHQRISNEHPTIPNYYQFKKFVYYKIIKDGTENEPEVHLLFFEFYRKRIESGWTNNYAFYVTRIRIIFSNYDLPYFLENVLNGSSTGTWTTVKNNIITDTLNITGGDWVDALTPEDWDTGTYPSPITSFNYIVNIPYSGYFAIHPLQYDINHYNAYVEEGFNEQLSLLDAFKLHLLSRVDTVYSKGYDIVRKPFKNSTAGSGYCDFGINGRYVKELTIEPTYYEKPDLSAIEMIANWERKHRTSESTDLVNLKDWTYELMETVPSGNAQKVKVTIILHDDTYSNLELGNKVKIRPLYNCFPDEPDTNELYFIVTSIKWNIMELELEGFRVAS